MKKQVLISIVFIAVSLSAIGLYCIQKSAEKKILVNGKKYFQTTLESRKYSNTSKPIEYNDEKNSSISPLKSKQNANKRISFQIRKTVSMKFNPQEAGKMTLGGTTLEAGVGSVSETKNLSITGLQAEDLPKIPSEISNITSEYAGYRFLPHGTVFKEAAKIYMAYDEALIPDGYTADDVYTYYFDESEQNWTALERDSVDYAHKLIISYTSHFTDMINGIIKVPESPETGGYTPTTIKDIKAADPMSGITMIAPPLTSKDGDANISFPFKLPAGRLGMQPTLELQYNSNSGSSWTGLGWDLAIPAISVDINWGVPRYLPDKESETYVLSGVQLTPVAHRNVYVNRTAEKQFHSRIEGEFSKIVRRGNSPKNYWWELTSKDGKKNFYGGTPENGVSANATSIDANGNIGHWALVASRDVHGNNVKYVYEKPTGCDQKLYISSITYTGKDSEDGAYKVTFLRTDETSTYARKDGVVTARSGYIERDRELLKRINISYKNAAIRSYKFWYKEGAFGKTLLDSLAELDADGKSFYKHSFKYFDDVKFANGYVPYEAQKTLNPQDDNIHNYFINPIDKFDDNVTSLGGSGSVGYGGGVAVTIGALDGKTWAKDLSAGGNGAYSGSIGYGLVSITDINGDGLPDKVYCKGSDVYYRPNIQDPIKIFGDPIKIDGFDNFSYTKTDGFGVGGEGDPPYLFIGYNYNKNYTKTPIYFSDFNGDGLVDIAKKGTVYFNHIDENGHVKFTTSSGPTPNPLGSNGSIDVSILPNTKAQERELDKNNPLHDAVRMWQAPFSGTVVINAPVQLMQDASDESVKDTLKDGVIVSIQYKGDTLWKKSIEEDDFTVKTPKIDTLKVDKESSLYFRVHSRYNAHGDIVKWDPEITYTSFSKSDSLLNTNYVDINNKKISRYKASEDFVLCGNQSVGMPKSGSIKLATKFSKPFTTDSVDLQIFNIDTLKNTTVIYSKKLGYEAVSELIISDTIDVQERSSMYFKVISPTYIDWAPVSWDLYIEYLTAKDGSQVVSNGKPMYTFKAIPEFTNMYNLPVRFAKPVIADSAFMKRFVKGSVDNNPHPIKLVQKFAIGTPDQVIDSSVLLFVRNKQKIFGSKKYTPNISNQLKGINGDTLIINVKLKDTLYFELYTGNYGMAHNSAASDVLIKGVLADSAYKATLYSYINYEKEIFGKLYRGWGQFDYLGDSLFGLNPINESLLKIDDSNKNINTSAITDSASLGGVNNPSDDAFTLMSPYGSTGNYIGCDQAIYITGGTMASSRRGSKNVFVEPIVLQKPTIGKGSGLGSIAKENTESSHSLSGGSSLPIVSSYTASVSWGFNNATLDIMDMNADGYPDCLTTDKIQYTGVLGAIEGDAVVHNLGDHSATAKAEGFTSGGGSVVPKTSNSTSAPVKSMNVGFGDNYKYNSNSKTAEKTSKVAIGTSGSFSKNTNETKSTWLDINNDGLPDKVYNDGSVRLNLGYSFAPSENWGFTSISKGSGKDTSQGLGINISNGSFTAGVSLAKTIGKTDEGLMDINGDGLPDFISVTNKTVRFNMGSGFSNPISWVGIDELDQSESVGESANMGFTIGIAIPVLGIKILVNPSGNTSHGVSRPTTQLGDFNFDGYPDYVSSSNESEINYKASTINRTNMLMAVNRPFGSKFTMNYIQSPATYEHPGGKWVLDSVKMFDGLTGDGADTTLTTYKYDKGYYDRHERQFFGFETVSTSYHNTSEKGSPVYRTTITHFDNKSYYTKGLVLSETLADANGRKQTGYENSYSPINIYTGEILNSSEFQNDSMSIFPALVSTKQFIYEGSNEPNLTTTLSYSYDSYGNIKNYTDYDSGDEKDLLKVDIGYHSVADKYIYSVPKQQDVTTSAGLIRQRKTEIDSLGEMISISQLLSEGKIANYNLEYDSYGNLAKITRPENESQQRLFYKYVYDPDIHSLVTGVSDAYGYSSSTSYNYLWGTPLETIDKNAEKVRYTYDNRGRVKTVTGPYELAGSNHYTISVNYFTDAIVPYAQTLHYDSANNSDIETFTFVDGLGRPIQIKKTSVVYNKNDSSESQGYSVSGKTIYDAFGRETAVYQHVFEAPGNVGKYNSIPDAVAPTTATYDVLDRITSVTLPDGAVIKHSYGIANYSNVNSQYDSTINPLGQIKLTYFDTKYRKLAEILNSDNGEVKTSYKYNPIGELLEVVDPKGNKTVFTYDLNGRRLSINHPDAGLTEFAYNPAGGLISKKTANLRKQIPGGGEITYKHDYERIKEVDYPRNVQNKVEYSYGQAGERFGRVGRLKLIQDATGGQEFYYGHLGEVVKTIRTIVLAKNDMRTWIWSATYDTWNRVQTMTYPDDEVISYKYNAAGNLKTLSGSKRGRNYKYIDQIGYDKEEKQVIMKYGNGTKVDYSYEPNRQNLTEMTLISGSQKLMDNVYSYDALSNLLSVNNDVKPSGNIGGSTSHSYSYDRLNRLVSANGRCISSDTSAYTLSMKYDIMGNILNKKQSLLVNGKKQKASSYDFDYKYDAVKPDAPDWVDSTQYLYDENGNLTYYEDSTSGTSRQLSWNEDNQLSMISDDGYVSNYTYDAFENRVIKSHGGTQGLYLNGSPVGLINHSDANYTVYVNPYFTLNSKTFTKHFYNGTKRIASKIGNGKFENQFRSGIFEITAGSVNYINRQQQFEKGKEDYYASLKLPPGPPTMKGAYSDPLTSGKAIPNTEATNTDVPPGWPSVIVYPEAGGTPGAPIHYGDSITNETAKAGFGYFGTGDAEETQCYYLHSDQLGSVNYVTDNTGKISQFVAYLPFGETLKEKHSNYNNSWKFNGKELDDETGLYCFGNRYYDPKISLFYSAAIQDFNKSVQSPYIYAADNPVFFIDSSTISTLATKTNKAVNIMEKSRSKTAQGQVKASWSISNDPELNFDTQEINSEEKDEDKDKDKDDNKQKNKKQTDNASEKNDNSDTKGETIDLIDNLLPDINSGGSSEGGSLKDNIKNAVKGAAIKAARTVIKDVLKDGVKATVKNYIDKGKNAINKIKSMPGKLLKGFENKMKKEKDKILK